MSVFAERRKRAAARLGEFRLDALLVTNSHNARYLSGFTGSNANVLLFPDGRATLYTDPRYTVQSKQQSDCAIRVVKGPLAKGIVSDVARRKLARLGFERECVTVGQFESLRKAMPARTEMAPVSGIVEQLRMVKDAGELDAIRKAVVANSRALENALKRFRPNMSEAEFAAEIDYQNRKLGAEAPAFDTIVAAGERAALPHAQPGAAKIGPGILLVDMGAFHAGYASDMTRMVHVGRATPKYRKAYTAVLEAQFAAINAVKAGAKTAAVDRAARRVLERHGLGKAFVHSTGHGLGLEIHEPPRLGSKDKGVLEAGMAITIEPGVYLEGWGGIRIEDTVVVTETGCEVLTPTTKELREI
jgi:Xaa-Pro aminopeptidase